ncbi:MAG: hypothetical protein AAF518_06720 [Spirochaetota bacterium]
MKRLSLLVFFLFIPHLLWGKPVRIFFTSSLNGYIKDCLCKINPEPGLTKRHTLLKSLGFNPNRDILLETGDIVDRQSQRKNSLAIFTSYRKIGYHAIGIGRNEIKLGKKFLQSNKAPLATANLYSKGFFSSKPLTREITSLRRQGKTIGIITLSSQRSLRKNLEKQGMQVLESKRILAKLVKKYRKDAWIVNFYGSLQEARVIADTYPKMLVIAGSEKKHPKNNRYTSTEKGNRVYHVGGEGEYLGFIQLNKSLQVKTNQILKPDFYKTKDSPLVLKIMKKYGLK